ncbi:glycoside hydrolase [Limnohabitans sp. MMS-10A-160]|uniref:glycosyltransferase family 4 protein n=1 Tax=Limnohabitans sp. MMS-10A-192 TaxID=1835769 RepID=UPI000D36657C|nr:glycosyltransferase family 1 protein [Limnohabitans sp. MMS-10A-192]PUE18603.1 glycoside hydrolase [Limnohabitans sp. MMS-10A-192]PUE23407.1 glycoside hydrolase [Limnohabitans sp. MMS-10A-160]
MSHTDQDAIWVENFEPAQQPLRIAVVTETWPPEVNGVALTLSKLVHHLRIKDHTIQLIRPRQDKYDIGDDKLGWTELLLRGLPIPKYPQLKLGLPSKKALIKAWIQKRPDLVHIATEGPLGWSALQAATLLRLPVTSDFRTNFHSYSKHYGVGWLSKPIVAYLRKFHNRTARTMVPTQSLRVQLEASGFQKLCVIARGVDTKLFHPGQRSQSLRDSWSADAKDIVLLSVGRLAAEKNLDLIVNTYTSLLQSGRKVKLVFAGDGPYRAYLQSKCPDAIFTGMCSHEELATVYASSDLFLFPSLTETFGNVTLEALACGTPVLAFDCAAAGEWVIEGQNGWLINGEDDKRYVLKALDICKDKKTLEKARQFTAASVANLDWHAIADQVEHIFRETIEASNIKAYEA